MGYGTDIGRYNSVKITIVASFEYTLVSTAGPNGSISPSENIPAEPGSDKTFTFTLNNRFIIDKVTVDSLDVAAQAANSQYTFTNVTANHTIKVSFFGVDSDDDGILDVDEDANRNDVVDAGETDPADLDSNDDGIQDGTESGITEADVGVGTDLGVFVPDADSSTITDSTNSNSDNDGLMDGVEDPNFNGKVDAGESNPMILNTPPVANAGPDQTVIPSVPMIVRHLPPLKLV